MQIKRNYKTHQIHWNIFGHGDRLLIALHGFGDKAATFGRLRSLEEHFTIYAPDLPFHGKTEWNAPTYTNYDLYQIIIEAVEHSGHSRFSIMGHSYGARIIFTLLPILHDRIERIYLLAPDGIQGKSGRAARLTPLWLRQRLVNFVEPPDRLFAFLRFIGAKYWMPKNSYDFVHLHLSRPHRRKRTFGTWLSMVYFPMEARQARVRLRYHNIPTEVFLGKNDLIIPPKAALFLKEKTACVRLHFLEEGHELIGEKLDVALEIFFRANLKMDT